MDKKCKKESCENTIEGRKKYCSDRCKYLHNAIRKDNEKHLPPIKKRNQNYFYMQTGKIENSLKGKQQGRRSGHMVKGSMSAIIYFMAEVIAPVTLENIEKHFRANSYMPTHARLCDGTFATEEELLNRIALNTP